MEDIQIQKVQSPKDLEQVFSIRADVFITEQGVPPSIERDEWDTTSTHVLAWLGGTAVGTARYRETSEGIKLERFAVLPPFRGRGIGQALVKFILSQLPQNATVYLNAQEGVIEFYERFGFQLVGPRFLEAGIVHQKMVLPLAKD